MAPSLERVQKRHWVLVAAAAAGWTLAGASGAGGVLVGGGLISLSVVITAAGLRAMARRAGARLAIGLLFVKLAAFLGLGWLLLASGGAYRPDPIGFVVGLSCFPAASVWEAMRLRATRR